MAKTIVVKQIGSPIRRPAKQRATLMVEIIEEKG